MGAEWVPPASLPAGAGGWVCGSRQVNWSGRGVDLVFVSNPEVCAVADVHAADDAGKKFVHDFVAAWAKEMDLDLFGPA